MRRRVIRSYLLLSAVLLASVSASAATVSLAPSKDNSIIQVSPIDGAQLSNGQGDLFVGRTNQDGQGAATTSIRRGLIAFDIAGSVPAGATITGVALSMREGMGNNGNRAIALHRTTAEWGEGASFFSGGTGAAAADGDATWFYRSYNVSTPALRLPWGAPGGDFSPTASASTIVTAGAADQLFTWSSAANPLLIADVQQWLADPSTNFGWTILGDETAGQTAKRFRSGESSTPPSLTIEYVIPEPTSLVLGGVALGGMLSVVRRNRRDSVSQSVC